MIGCSSTITKTKVIETPDFYCDKYKDRWLNSNDKRTYEEADRIEKPEIDIYLPKHILMDQIKKRVGNKKTLDDYMSYHYDNTQQFKECLLYE